MDLTRGTKKVLGFNGNAWTDTTRKYRICRRKTEWSERTAVSKSVCSPMALRDLVSQKEKEKYDVLIDVTLFYPLLKISPADQ